MQFWKSIYHWSIIVASIAGCITAVAGVIIAVSGKKIDKLETIEKLLEESRKEEERKAAALKGKLESKQGLNPKLPVMVWFGSNATTTSMSLLRTGYKFKPFYQMFGSDFELTLKLDSGKILLSTDFRSFDGKLTARITNNKWVINPNDYFERHYNKNRLEVTDRDGINKFQIDFSDPNNIRLGGVIVDSRLMIIMNGRGEVLIRKIKSLTKQEAISLSKQAPSWF